jgi:hypothetical protein
MDWIRQSADDASERHARRLASVILATAGAVVLATACVACSQATPSSVGPAGASHNVVTLSAGSSQAPVPSPGTVTSSAGSSNGSGCPTQGLGGDTVSPVCVTPVTSSGHGVTGVPTPSSSPISSPSSVAPAGTLPRVNGISPPSGASAGGDNVTITGSGFTGATQVEFGGVSAQMTVNSDTEITATSPPGSGTADITVVTPNGTSATSPADQFTYQG